MLKINSLKFNLCIIKEKSFFNKYFNLDIEVPDNKLSNNNIKSQGEYSNNIINKRNNNNKIEEQQLQNNDKKLNNILKSKIKGSVLDIKYK